MIKFFGLIVRLASKVYTKLSKYRAINLIEYYRGMCLATAELAYLLKRNCGSLRGYGTDSKRDKHLVNMKSWIMVTQMIYFKMLNG
mgnify:CR=1 FL=1